MRYGAQRSAIVFQNERPFSLAATNGEWLRGYVQGSGCGPAGVFVHGFRSTCAGDKSLVLAQSASQYGRSWVRFDLRGHGDSGGEFRNFRISAALDDVLNVVDWCPRVPLVIIGSSLGGWLGVLAAQARPQRISRLMLIAPAFNFIEEVFATIPATQLRAWRERGEMRFDDTFTNGQFSLPYAVLDDARRFDVLDRDLCLPCPVDIYHGEQDEIASIGLS
ncbi:MAG: alpha/beta fold hydrolase, partial [Gammaproteobacteria bacterium]|nr:alpha/beta fold hydrolase [Gammaproteobacteria bacterium]